MLEPKKHSGADATYKVVELPEAHGRADFLTHSDERNANHCKRLIRHVLFHLLLLLFLAIHSRCGRCICRLSGTIGCTLVGFLVFCLFRMIRAMMQHFLDEKHVAGGRIRASLNQDLALLAERMFDGSQQLDGRIRLVLFAWRTVAKDSISPRLNSGSCTTHLGRSNPKQHP